MGERFKFMAREGELDSIGGHYKGVYWVYIYICLYIYLIYLLSICKVPDTVVVGELDSVLFQNVNLMPVIDE